MSFIPVIERVKTHMNNLLLSDFIQYCASENLQFTSNRSKHSMQIWPIKQIQTKIYWDFFWCKDTEPNQHVSVWTNHINFDTKNEITANHEPKLLDLLHTVQKKSCELFCIKILYVKERKQ